LSDGEPSEDSIKFQISRTETPKDIVAALFVAGLFDNRTSWKNAEKEQACDIHCLKHFLSFLRLLG
jgi:hypothetical protein